MRPWFRRFRRLSRGSHRARHGAFRPLLETLEERALLDAGTAGFVMTNLVSDIAGLAARFDANLINPWGFAETPQGRFQVSSNGAGLSIDLSAHGVPLGQPIVIPTPAGSAAGSTATPNGAFFNTTGDFVITENGKSAPAEFIFSTEDGTIAAFNPTLDPTHAVIVNDQSSAGAVFKLLAEASTPQGNYLYATDFHNGTIDVFDKNFNKVTLGTNGFGTFTDPNPVPPGFAPFGIKEINGQLFVTYAKQAPGAHDDQEGPGNGFIDVFDNTGHFITRFATGTAVTAPGGGLGTAPLNSPIGMAVAPPGFGPNGEFGGALLVGNFGDSHVSAFNLQTGQFLGQLSDANGNPLVLNGGFKETNTKGLWGIAFGNGKGGTNPNTLYFAAGINQENAGLFGAVTMEDPHDPHTPTHAAATTMPMAASRALAAPMSQPMMMPPSGGAASAMSTPATPMSAPTILQLAQRVLGDFAQLESEFMATRG